MKQKVIIIEEDQSVYEAEIDESEIPSLLEDGFVSAILRNVEERIEYANIKYDLRKEEYSDEVLWEIPHKKE